MRWTMPTQDREQLVLFATKLDDIVGHDHAVRVVDRVLSQLDWTALEAKYNGRIGKPPIHPRVLCGILLHGLISGIRASRKLEEALHLRADFRWLAHGMSIDHTTLSEFRRKHPDELRDLFVQIVLVGKSMGVVQFRSLGFDGTHLRANNRKTGTRTPAELRQAKEDIQAEFDRINANADLQDDRDQETFGEKGNSGDQTLNDAERLKELQRMQANVDAALQEIEKINQSSETMPKRLPITDPESRFGKTKEGGFAPCYTPTATVDTDSGLILDEGVIPQSNESGELMGTIAQVQADYGLENPVPQMLADGLMANGENIQACEQIGVDLYSPVPGTHKGENPALREDLRKPVPSEKIDELPMRTVTIAKKKEQRFAKAAFIYDAEQDIYYCPAGEVLRHSSDYQTTSAGKQIERSRYRAEASACSACPLSGKCLSGSAELRQVDRGQHEDAIERQKAKMNREGSAEIYAGRRHPGERPFAVIKSSFGARQFLTRGLKNVQTEWRWLATAFNLHRLLGYIRSGVDPP